MEYKRADRVGDQIQREVSRMLHEEIKDPRIGMVTITRVQVSGDLHYAKIYFTVFGEEAQRRESADGLNKAAGFVRRQIGQYLRLRLTPEISFHYDDNLDHAARIDSILHEIHMQNGGAEKKPATGGPKRKGAVKNEAPPEEAEDDSVDAVAGETDLDDEREDDDQERADDADEDDDADDDDADEDDDADDEEDRDSTT